MSDTMETPSLPTRVLADRVRLEIPSLPNWIEPTVDYLRQRAVLAGVCQETRSGKLMVALHEAIANAVIHGNLEVSSELKEQSPDAFAAALASRAADRSYASRTVEIVIDYDGDLCHWVITDQGKGFDVERVLARCLSDDPQVTLASGRGILMMKSLLDDVRYELSGRRCVLALERKSGAEKRRDRRAPVTRPFTVTPLLPDGRPNWESAYDAVSLNLSEHGIALLQKQLVSSQQILIGIPTAQGIINVPAEVKNSRPFGVNGVEIGCQFLSALAPASRSSLDDARVQEAQDAVARMLAGLEAEQLPAHERRQHPRVVFSERLTVFIEGRAEPMAAYARDLSKGGIAFISQEALPSDITIAFAPHGEARPLRIRCQVKRCDCIQEGFYDVGAAFVHLDGT